MTVSTTNITSGPYTGNNVATSFSYTFRIELDTQLQVYETDPAGVVTLLALTTDYTVAGVGVDAGGLITRVAGALPTGFIWYIRANYAASQGTAFASQGGFFPAVHESAIDKLTFLVQQVLDSINRAIRHPDSDPTNSVLLLPDAVSRSDKVLGFSPVGDLLMYDTSEPVAVASRAPRGNTTITVSNVDVTLTANQFDNASFDVTGTLTANVNIIVPDGYAQQFVVDNATTGVFTLIVKHATTAGVAITQGSREIVYTTGVVVESVAQSVSVAASAVANTPAGNIAATEVQAAINELDAEKQPAHATGAAVASATSTDLRSATGDLVHITGVNPIVEFIINANQRVKCIADAALPLTYNATTNALNSGAANVTLAAGDRFDVYSDGTTVRLDILKLDGRPVVDSRGTATAWVNFNGTGVVAIRDSFNVSSITDDGVGLWTVNFATPMANANYVCVVSAATANGRMAVLKPRVNVTTTSVGVSFVSTTGTELDADNMNVTIFGGV